MDLGFFLLPAMGGPTMAATPLSKQSRPNALVNWAIPSKSTKTIDVSAMKAAAKKQKKKKISHQFKSKYKTDLNIQEKSPKKVQATQKLA